MVVRLVCVIRVPLCARCPVCVPCVSRLPPVSFYRFVCVIRVPVCARVSCVSRVNVNTTDATAGATALCVPAPPGVFLPVQ